MSDLELEVADSFDRVFPVPIVVADWDDVLDRAGAEQPHRARSFRRRSQGISDSARSPKRPAAPKQNP